MSLLKNLESQFKKNNIEQVQICYIDYCGRLCGKLIPVSKFESIVSKGVVFAKANLSFGLDDHFAKNAKFLANTGDFFATPDLESYTQLKHRPGVARFFTNMMNEEGNNWDGCPRNKLQKLINEYKQLNINIKLSLESEFSIYTKENESYVPFSFDGMFTISGMDKIHFIWEQLYESLKLNNIKIEQVGKEYGPGQYEATWEYSDVIKSIDNYLNFKDFVKSIMRENNYYATFMAKPFDHYPGNGLHVHLSLWDNNNNEISCSNNNKFPLSELGSHFVAGILSNAHSLTATGCASINSYKRIIPGSWSPAHICWGNENRSTLIRIPGKENRRHIELRHGDNVNNPYIYVNTILASGLEGIKKKLSLEDPFTEDAGEFSDKIDTDNLKILPRSFKDSLSYLKKNNLFKKYLGDLIYDEFIKIKETELHQHDTTVHKWERDKYFEVF